MRWVVLNAALLGIVGLAVVSGQVLDRPEASVEATVRRYAVAVSDSDLQAAMREIAPERRAAWTDWVRGQLGNVYEVRGIAVRSPSAQQRLFAHAPGGPFEVTSLLDVNRGYPEDFYQPTTRVPVEAHDGQWYLSTPLLAPDEPPAGDG